jgi:hypothetical protein
VWLQARLQHRLGYFLHEQRNAVGPFDDVMTFLQVGNGNRNGRFALPSFSVNGQGPAMPRGYSGSRAWAERSLPTGERTFAPKYGRIQNDSREVIGLSDP